MRILVVNVNTTDFVTVARIRGEKLRYLILSEILPNIIGPVLAGLLVDRGSYALAFGVTGAITLLAAVPWLRARETHVVPRAVRGVRGR